ncbi:MAG: hypothetical protein LBV69_01155 [Bacteroidales bacterium]|jgi:hypothetical protein|nr:hypothetical protein [Bacteroidales bacterium]
MQKTYLIILTFISLVFTVNAQNVGNINNNIFTEYNKSRTDKHTAIIDSLIINNQINKNVENYYKNVYVAQNLIMKGKFRKAAKTYQNAFTYLKNPFSIDLHHALICELKSEKNLENIKKYIQLLILKDEKKEIFLEDSSYISLSNWNVIKKIIDSLQNNIDTTLCNEIKNIYITDQNLRRKHNNMFENLSDSDELEIFKIDSINYYSLMELLDKNPIISEELIGISGWENFQIIPWHNSFRLDIYPILFKSVINGNLDARKFYDILGHSEYRIKGEYSIGITTYRISSSYCSQIVNIDNFEMPDYFIVKKYADLKILDKFRKKIYIEPFENFQKKSIWLYMNRKIINNRNFCSFTIELSENIDFFTILRTKKYGGENCNIYYRNHTEQKQIETAMKEYYKNNNINDSDNK